MDALLLLRRHDDARFTFVFEPVTFTLDPDDLRLMARVIKLSTFVASLAAEITLLEHLEVFYACADRDADHAEASVAKRLLKALSQNLGLN